MSDATAGEMPKGLWARAMWAAEQTPESRNRAVDLYRAIAILFVVFGHWLLVAPQIVGDEVKLTILLAEQPVMQYATWVAQVMPVFFFVGGFSNSLSWQSALRDPVIKHGWAATRLSRLLQPTVPLILVWAALTFLGGLLGMEAEQLKAISQAALVPIWFLAVYIVITVAVPLAWRLWQRMGVWSVALLAALAVIVDVFGLGLGHGWLRWTNYAFVWLAVHQLGFWWHSEGSKTLSALGLVALGVAWLAVLLVVFGYPISMVSVPGAEFSNTRPPTTAMLAIGSVQIGLILLLEAPAKRWLEKSATWARVILVNQMIMTVYLWHMTALILLIGASFLLGGVGLAADPGSGAWWTLRPVWMVVLIAALTPFLLAFMRFESGSRVAPSDQPGPARALIGALVTCSGLVTMAIAGLASDNAVGVNWIAVLAVVGGVALATRPALPGKSSA